MTNQICTVGKFGGGKFGELTLSEPWRKKVWRINTSVNRLLIVITNLDGFTLANHWRFAKFAKLSPAKLSCYMVIQTYFTTQTLFITQIKDT